MPKAQDPPTKQPHVTIRKRKPLHYNSLLPQKTLHPNRTMYNQKTGSLLQFNDSKEIPTKRKRLVDKRCIHQKKYLISQKALV
ncbi:MAG TPA: hypothetical protein VK541_20500 [Pedobacter sp.]|uniref:hypothetical protein n=1 Tax=Pedobacter sp. TaxID=1411316 RepID=UPI002D0A74F6|nr:hypothetical protein [Pedobacter sp.]HMI04881.1 hypothetical protein [Pedobacter sp.]